MLDQVIQHGDLVIESLKARIQQRVRLRRLALQISHILLKFDELGTKGLDRGHGIFRFGLLGSQAALFGFMQGIFEGVNARFQLRFLGLPF